VQWIRLQLAWYDCDGKVANGPLLVTHRVKGQSANGNLLTITKRISRSTNAIEKGRELYKRAFEVLQ